MPIPLKCPGVGRDAGNVSALQFYFNRRVTDDEMRFLHDVIRRAVACAPGTGVTTSAQHGGGMLDLRETIKLVERREALCRRQIECPCCGGAQVQLVDWSIAPADWKCRECKMRFSAETGR